MAKKKSSKRKGDIQSVEQPQEVEAVNESSPELDTQPDIQIDQVDEVSTEPIELPNDENEVAKPEDRIDSVDAADTIDTTHDDAQEIGKITNEPEKIDVDPKPTATVNVPKKRLTLQERLALAAKSGKTKKSISVSASSPRPTSPEPNSIESSKDATNDTLSVSSKVTTREPSIDLPRSPIVTHVTPEDYKNLSHEELLSIITETENKYRSLENENKSLQEKLKSTPSSSGTVNDQLLKEKDNKIAQLLKEGEELSVKELKYNNSIKKLKAKDSENQYLIEDLTSKVSNFEIEVRSLKETLKNSKDFENKSKITTKTLQVQLDNEKSSLKEEISRNQTLSSKIEELSQAIIQEKNQYTRELNEIKRELQKERQASKHSETEHIREVGRLESKIEQLRFQSENAQTSTSTNDEAYIKLVRQHETLQNQYTSATQNWQSIEATLLGKINSSELAISKLNDQIKESELKTTILSQDLSTKISQLEELNNEHSQLKKDYEKLQVKLASVNKSLEEFEETNETQLSKFNQEKSSLEYKIRTLERQIKDSIQPQTITTSDSYNNISLPSILQRNNTSSSSIKLPKSSTWDPKDISFGESSTTPLQSRKSSAAYFVGNQSFDENDTNDLSDFEDNDTINSPVSQFHGGSRFDNHSSSAIGGSSVQLIGKMSSQVRRLETELSTMREEFERLTLDKKATNEEVVRLMKDNEQTTSYKSKIEYLEKELEKATQRHERTLEILGEKSEQVEELRADVADLKDLCKFQVQQLVELSK